MSLNLVVIGAGAVTPVGFTAPQTCEAIRAGISGVGDAMVGVPPEEPQLGATVPAGLLLKVTQFQWLKNLAVRAIKECLEVESPEASETALLIAMPEKFRNHPAFYENSAADLYRAIEHDIGNNFHSTSKVIQGGHASTLQAVSIANALLLKREVRYCIVGGVDSLVNKNDLNRLSAANRIYDSENSQGVVPGEAASFILLTLKGNNNNIRSTQLAQILGVGSAVEQDSILGQRYSVGLGLHQALINTTKNAALKEDNIDFLISDVNGERYRVWESTMCHAKYYRTRRETLISWYPAKSVGDIGAAAGALNIIVAVMAVFRGYAPGSTVMCEGASEEGLRAGCLVGRSVVA